MSQLGPNSALLAEATRPFMSAMPSIATKAVRGSETSRCAKTGRELSQQSSLPYSITSSARNKIEGAK
jgi:hypothetical protein